MAQIFAGQRIGVRRHFVGRAVRHDFAAMLPGSGTEINQIIGAAHRLFVMLDNQNRVAEVTQRHQHFNQFRVVTLMQADARLVKDI